jgi:hypothetical protein
MSYRSKLLSKSVLGTFFLVLMCTVPTSDLAAQQAPWTISVEVESGLFAPTKAFGKNSGGTEDPDLIFLQPSAQAEPVAIFGGGIRIQLPNPTMSLRLSAFRTGTGTVEARTPACDVLSPTDPDAVFLRGRLNCDGNFEEDFTVSEVMARLQFKRLSDEGNRLRPTIDLGVGLRQYDFSGQSCPITLLKEAEFICKMADDLTTNQTKPMLMFGIGLEYTLERWAVFVRVHDQVAPYGDGVRGTVGQNDLLGSVGFSINVR